MKEREQAMQGREQIEQAKHETMGGRGYEAKRTGQAGRAFADPKSQSFN